MKYESTILKRLIDTYGVVGNPHYISEIIKEFIVRGKECFPNLFTYQADWLAHIDEFGLNPTYTVSYTGQSIYAPNTLERPVKSAILKGSTKYREIDTGEILEAFEEGRNLELVSVKMPGLTTIGKNLIKGIQNDSAIFDNKDVFSVRPIQNESNTIKLEEPIILNEEYTLSFNVITSNNGYLLLVPMYGDGTNGERIGNWDSLNGWTKKEYNLPKNGKRMIGFTFIMSSNHNCVYVEKNTIQLEQGTTATSYEPYKSNILTVNEDVTLRSSGDICDELNLLTGQLTQRIGEDGVVLSQEVVKTVDLTILDQNEQSVDHLKSFNGGTHVYTSSLEGSLVPSVDISVVTNLEETLMMCSTEGNTI